MKVSAAIVVAAIMLMGIQAANGKPRTATVIRPAAARQPVPVPPVTPAAELPAETIAGQPVAEEVPAPSERTPDSASDPLATEAILRGKGIPASPYPAGLSYMMTPQPFRVPYPDRIYYPPKHYVHLCPYYPRGVYWGADWNKRLLGRNPWLIHGAKRFNPYLTDAKIRHYSRTHGGASHQSSCPHCGQVHVVGDHVTAMPEDSMSEEVSAEIAEMPRPPARQAAPPETEPAQDEPMIASSARPKPAPQTVRTARQTLPPWQRPPHVHR